MGCTILFVPYKLQPAERPAPLPALLGVINHPFAINQMLTCISPAAFPAKMDRTPARTGSPTHLSGKQRINIRLAAVTFLFCHPLPAVHAVKEFLQRMDRRLKFGTVQRDPVFHGFVGTGILISLAFRLCKQPCQPPYAPT